MSGPREESYRATVTVRTPDGERTTLIVLRLGLGRDGRVWLVFDGAIRTTAVLTNPESEQLRGMLGDAEAA